MENLILEMKNITKVFPGVKALDNVNFSVRKGEVHCLIGANGAGKSTLMKVLSGAYRQDGGEVIFDGEKLGHLGTLERRKKGLAVIYQELSLVPEQSVAENIFLNEYPMAPFGIINWKEVYRKSEELVKKLNLNIDVHSKVSDLSMGHKQLVEIMKALASNAKLIVMDEPSSTLSKKDFEILKKLIFDLKNQGITIIYISHHLEELFLVGDRVTVLRDGKFVTCTEIKNIKEDELVEYMTGKRLEHIELKLEDSNLSSEVVLELQGLTNDHVNNISFKLHKGEIFGMYGLVGAGRTETIRSIFGVDPYKSGNILLKGKHFKPKSTAHAIKNGIGLMPEDRRHQGLVQILPVWENMMMVSMKKHLKGIFINYSKIDELAISYKEKLDIKTPSKDTLVQSLSGGNQQKVIMSKWLVQDCEILMIDEPTQGIDVMVKRDIYRIIKQLADSGKSIIVVSSEIEELVGVCDRIFVMYDGHEVTTVTRSKFDVEKILNMAVTGKEKV